MSCSFKLTLSSAVRLPVLKLLNQLKENSGNHLVSLLDKRFLERGFGRLAITQKADSLPDLISAISTDPNGISLNGQAEIFHLLLKSLDEYRLPPRGTPDDEGLKSKLGVDESNGRVLSVWCAKLILLNINRDGVAITSPGLSSQDVAFLTLQGRAEAWDSKHDIGLSLSAAKLKALQFLASGAFSDDDRFLPALYASANSNSFVAGRGEDLLKHIAANSVLEDSGVIKELFRLYFEGSHQLKARILTFLCRSGQSVSFSSEVIRVITEGLSINATGDLDIGADSQQKAGREVSKLQSEIFNFANYFLRSAQEVDLIKVSEEIAPTLRHFINGQGWPSAKLAQDLSLRSKAYELLGSTLKSTQNADFQYLIWFFDSLREDSSGSEVTMSIEQGLSYLISVYSSQKYASSGDESLTQLLLHSMQGQTKDANRKSQSRRRTRYATVRFANRCLRFDNVIARWINILALAGEHGDDREIAEEGKKGLDPFWFKSLNSEQPWLWKSTTEATDDELVSFPPTVEMLLYVFNQSTDDEMYDDDTEDFKSINSSAKQKVEALETKWPRAFGAAIKFCRLLVFHTALKEHEILVPLTSEWERALLISAKTDAKARIAIRAYLDHYDSAKFAALSALLFAALKAMNANDVRGLPGCEELFVELVTLSPRKFLDQCEVGQMHASLHATLKSTNTSIRQSGARAFGILFAIDCSSNPGAESGLAQLFSSLADIDIAVGQKVNEIDGNMQALAFALSRMHALSGGANHGIDKMFQQYFDILCKTATESRDLTLTKAAFASLGQLSIFMALPQCLPASQTDPTYSIDGTVLQKLLDEMVKKARTTAETAIQAVGRISVCLPEDKGEVALAYVDDQLHKLHDIKQTEAQFAVGEALACLAAGWDCTALSVEADVEGMKVVNHLREKTLVRILNRTIKDCAASKPSLRKASVIWLLSLLDYCGHIPAVQNCLRECQAAFKHCLADRDTLVQEAASRGLGLVYEKADKALKDDVVRDLVGSFTDNKPKFGGEVTEDTELFEPGALPTGDGSISTYKDVLSLAAEVGDPSLVYRFMSMASHDAIWSSRAAFGRFGLSSVFSDSSVNTYMTSNPKLYATLYRYRFDPNPNVRRSMNDIWTALIKDSNKVLDEQFDGIMNDLLKNILAREWRVREACCGAIADLIQGRKFEKVEKHLSDIWTKCFKVLDDIKSSVTMAALSLARVLMNLLIRSLEAGDQSAKNSSVMLKHVLPFLQSYGGIGARSKVVKGVSIGTIIEIVKKGSPKVLRPFITEFLELLIPLLDESEAREVEYLRMNASDYKITEQTIDDLRLKSVSSSPIMEAIERCLDFLDEESCKQMAAGLENAMKTVVGLPSKVGCSRILVSMATRRRGLFEPYAGRFLKLIEKASMDRNETVSSSYAVASGYLGRLATDDEILRLAEFAKRLYTTSEDEKHRALSGDVMASLSKHAPDRFNSLASDLLPFIFIAKHDENDAVKELYENAWNEHVAGSRAINLYLKEIMTLAESLLSSPKWTIKHSAAYSIADATSTLASSIDGISAQSAAILWPALEKAIGGKSWEGKEKVVQAFAKFVESSKAFFPAKPDFEQDISKVSGLQLLGERSTLRSIDYPSRSPQTESRLPAARFESPWASRSRAGRC